MDGLPWLIGAAVLILWGLSLVYAYLTGCVDTSRLALKSLEENQAAPDWLERQKRVYRLLGGMKD
jgi:hypothetical protein